MNDRYIARVSMHPEPVRQRAVATARVTREPPLSPPDHRVARGVAAPAAAVRHAEPVEAETAMLQPPDLTRAIFVDGSGRRGQLLRRLAYVLVAVLLVLLAAFWLLQGLDIVEPGT